MSKHSNTEKTARSPARFDVWKVHTDRVHRVQQRQHNNSKVHIHTYSQTHVHDVSRTLT